MRQEKGTEILGADDPRSEAIGIIHVSPNDDRTSVLAAILTQEKLGRKQVAVVLPEGQNKAFQRPGDFDDLKTMRRKMQTQVIFIAASGTGPAEFARQRRFLVYSSLENYANALRDDKQGESIPKKGGLFNPPRAKVDPLPATPVPAMQDSNTSSSDENRRQYNGGSALPLAGAAALGGGAFLAADAMHVQGNDPVTPISDDPSSDPIQHTPPDFGDDQDALSPATTPASTPDATELSGTTQAIPPAYVAPSYNDSKATATGPRGMDLGSGSTSSSRKATVPLQDRAPAPPTVMPSKAGTTTAKQAPKRSSGKIADGGAGIVAGTVMTSPATAPPARAAAAPVRASATPGNVGTVTPRPGGPIPPRTNPPRRGNGGNRRGPAGRIFIGLIIVALLLLIGTIAVMAAAQPKSGPGQFVRAILPAQQSPATITITPNSPTVEDTYTLTGATTTNPATREVGVRTISGAAPSPSTLVKATGQNQHPAVAATGQITFFNALTFDQQVNAGTTFPLGRGLQIITDTNASIPAGNGVTNGVATVNAHANPTGTIGNIGALTINNLPCCGVNSGIIARNLNAFTGGRDATDYAFLQQSDVNNAISQSIMNTTKQDALNDLTRQLHPGEQAFGSPRCTPTLKADQPVDDKGVNVTSANITYIMKCTTTVYDNLGAQNIIKGLLTQKAAITPGAGYILVNNTILVTLTNQTTVKNVRSLFFTGKGVWAYQFSDAQKLQLAKAIAGKTVAEANTILKNTPGISNATINVNGGNVLPADYNQISIVIQPIAGLGGGTPSPSSGSPIVTSPTVGSGTPGTGKGAPS